MKREVVLEFTDVEVAAITRLVGRMQPDAEVAADNQHPYIDAEAYTGSGSEIAQERRCFQFSSRTVGVFLKQPYVAGVEENGAVERPEKRETVFDVELELECTRLVEVAVDLIGRHAEGTGAYGTHGKSADRIGASAIELLGIGNLGGVSVSVGRTDGHAADEPVVAVAETTVIDKLGLSFDELGERGVEERLLALLPARLIYGPEEISGLGH